MIFIFAQILVNCSLNNFSQTNGDKNPSGSVTTHYPVSNYIFKVNKRSTKTMCEICSKLTIKTPERRHWCHLHRSGIFIVNFERISNLFILLFSYSSPWEYLWINSLIFYAACFYRMPSWGQSIYIYRCRPLAFPSNLKLF